MNWIYWPFCARSFIFLERHNPSLCCRRLQLVSFLILIATISSIYPADKDLQHGSNGLYGYLPFFFPCVTATIEDHKNIIYTLPRPGIQVDEDCYINIYQEDLSRDMALIAQLGATTVMTWNGWDFDVNHDALLSQLAKHNLTLAITFKPDLDGTMRKKLDKLKMAISKWQVKLEFVFLDYPLDFDNAEDFFLWIIQVQGWMIQKDIIAPVLIRFFSKITNEKMIEDLLLRWDNGHFDAWVIEAYSVPTMQDWLINKLRSCKKKVFFIYGSDSWDSVNRVDSFEEQDKQLNEMIKFTLDPKSLKPASGKGGGKGKGGGANSKKDNYFSAAIQGYSDVWYLGIGAGYYQGGTGDICPDKNPYIQSSCGGVDENIEFGDSFYSVEHLGLFKGYETCWYFRCLVLTPATRTVASVWKSGNFSIQSPICSISLTIPGMFVYYMWAGGLLMGILGVILSCCKSSCRARQHRAKQKKMKMDKVVIDDKMSEQYDSASQDLKRNNPPESKTVPEPKSGGKLDKRSNGSEFSEGTK